MQYKHYLKLLNLITAGTAELKGVPKVILARLTSNEINVGKCYRNVECE